MAHVSCPNTNATNRDSHPYELNALLDSGFQFPTEPADGIDSVRVRKMRLSIKGLPRRRITLEADPDGGPNDIYEMMADYRALGGDVAAVAARRQFWVSRDPLWH